MNVTAKYQLAAIWKVFVHYRVLTRQLLGYFATHHLLGGGEGLNAPCQ